MENQQIKIVFIGTPDFGAVILEKLCQASVKPVLVVTSPDKPVGRKQVIVSPPVKLLAQSYKIPVIQPEKIENCKLEIEKCNPELVVTASYGQILPEEMLDIPEYGCLNVHPSLLPKYRGPSPIQYAILNGDKETGVTIILMDERMDTGPIIAQRKTEIGFNETAKELRDRLAVLGAELLIDAIPDWVGGRINLNTQNEKEATYTKILDREDGKIDLQSNPQELYNKIKAFNPWPGTYAILEKDVIRIKDLKKKIKQRVKVRLKILRARLENGKLIIEEVQPEGSKPMKFQDFLLGHKNYYL